VIRRRPNRPDTEGFPGDIHRIVVVVGDQSLDLFYRYLPGWFGALRG
jgi:hypothetical protein